MTLIEFIGWLGAFLLLLGFTLNVFRIIHAGTKLYLSLNFISSSLLLYNAYMIGAFPFVVVNATWMLFSLYKLLQKVFIGQK